MFELFHEITASLRRNKLRTALTGFAVSWGIFLLICLLGAGNGIMNSFIGNIDDFISTNIRVEGWRTSKPYAGYKAGRMIELDESDALFTEGSRWSPVISNVTRNTGTTSVTLSKGSQSVSASISGVMPEYREQAKMRMSNGRFINETDLNERRKVIVVSLYQAKELCPDNPEALLGQWVNAGAISFRVVGIYQTDESDMSRLCPIPFDTYKTIYDTSDKLGFISFSVTGPKTLEEHTAFENEYGGALRLRHDVAPDDGSGIWIDNGYVDNLELSKATRIIRIALWILGLLTLISGIVGVSNIMLITVKERTHEFGIRKAIGAKPEAILKLIISESVAITTVFGYIGMFLGMLACEIMDRTAANSSVDIGTDGDGQLLSIKMLVEPYVGLDVALEATIVLIIAGTLAGIIPAWKAARVKPIEALRAE